jgi:DNA-binding NarL/FixJ family response regulator
MTSMRMIADDTHLVRWGVTGILAKEADCEVSAEASDASETIGKARQFRPA